MTDKDASLRIDEILLSEGLVNEEQIKEALRLQKEQGGRIGSHLMKHGFIDETGLVRALAKQRGCDGVVLTGLEIPDIIIKFIPARVARARTVLPFDYDPERNLLKVACEDPDDSNLIGELNFVMRGKNVKLFIAAELSLTSAIAQYYIRPDGTEEVVDAHVVDGGSAASGAEDQAVAIDGNSRGSILLVTDEVDQGADVRAILEKQYYRVMQTDSADDAIDIIGEQTFDTVFIKDTVPGDYIDLIDRLRKSSPRTLVRYYDHAANLLLKDETGEAQGGLLTKSLEVLTSLLASKGKLPVNHSVAVGKYTEMLCRRLGLPEKDRMAITTAGYLHDLAKHYYTDAEIAQSARAGVEQNAKLLDSLNYSPLVVGVVRSMYVNLHKKYTKRLPIEILGGNIVTIVDIFCDSITENEPISLDKFEAIKTKLNDLTGKLFLSEVVEAFAAMIQDEMLAVTPDEKFGQVMLFADAPGDHEQLQQRLRREGFRVITQHSFDSFVRLYQRGRPDIIILISHGDMDRVATLVDDLAVGGIEVDKVPTFLLADQAVASQSSALLEKGIEDVLPRDDNLSLLIVKMKKIRSRIGSDGNGRSRAGEETGSYGSLENMSLIDLLQALGPSRKTVRITVSSTDRKCVIYLNAGDITYAQEGELLGAEAVYSAMAWSSGAWRVEPVASGELPEPNNEFSNESLLMEGCRLLDERTHNESHDTPTARIEQF